MFTLLSVVVLLGACKQSSETTDISTEQVHKFALPAWAKNANIYEVNVRQYTPEGTFNAFATHLDRLKDMGVDILWLMPIYPISEKNRKATNELFASEIKDPEERKKYFGSPYAVADYKKVNPDLGTAQDFKDLVSAVHARDMKIILDYVPNHTGWDNPWITDHPDWYTQDAEGNIIDPIDPGTGKSWGWIDVADLNYDNKEMRAAQIDALLFWVNEMKVDGFRQDVAHNVPVDFWGDVADALTKANPEIFLLAEAEVEALRNNQAFHADYGWGFHHLMNGIAHGDENASDIDKWMRENESKYSDGFHIHFTSNHDENTWSGTVFDRMGDAHKALAVLSATFDGMPLIYGGQEEPLRHRLSFFGKDDIGFSKYEYHDFYSRLLTLKHENEALWNGEYGGDLKKIIDSDQIYGFTREKNGDHVTVIINLSKNKASANIKTDLMETKDIFTGKPIKYKEGETVFLEPWSYLVGSN